MSGRIFALVLCAVLLCWSPRAKAQPGPRQDATPVVDPAAEFATGVAAYDLGRFEEALAAFERSYAARPVAAVLYNIAATQLALRRHDDAAASYRRYLAEDVSITPERRAEVDGILSDLGRRVSRLVLHVHPTGAEVRVDGSLRGVAPLPDPLELDPGEHTIEVVREGHVFEPLTLTLPAGIEQTLTLRARVLPPAVLPAREDPARRPDHRDRDDRDGGLLASPIFWIVTSVVVVGAGTAVTWYLTRSDEGPPQMLRVRGAFDALVMP